METNTIRLAFSDSVDWEEALADFLLQPRTSREEGTERFYPQRLGMLRRWASEKERVQGGLYSLAGRFERHPIADDLR